jgi:hypothetical protein
MLVSEVQGFHYIATLHHFWSLGPLFLFLIVQLGNIIVS